MPKISDVYALIHGTPGADLNKIVNDIRAEYKIPVWVSDQEIRNAVVDAGRFPSSNIDVMMQALARTPEPSSNTSKGFNLITDEARNRLLALSPSPDRITPDYIQSRIRDVTFIPPNFDKGETFTLCKITLDNSFVVFGESACVDPANYRKDLGEKIAYDKAFEKLWPLFGFLLSEKRFVSGALNIGACYGGASEPGEHSEVLDALKDC